MSTMFTTIVFVHVPKYISGQHLYKQAHAGSTKWKLWRAAMKKLLYLQLLCLSMFPNISGQHLYEQADASTEKWKLWHAGMQK